MSTIRFSSLLQPTKIGYLLETDYRSSWVVRNCPTKIHPQTGMYDTYGDGNVQHSAETPIPVSYFADWCASLATYIQAGNNDVLASIAYIWPSRHSDYFDHSKVMKASKIRYKEGKRQYFNPNDMAISTSDSKRHDKRWFELGEWADGSLESVSGLIGYNGATISGLELYVKYDQLSETLEKINDRSYSHPAGYLPQFKMPSEDSWYTHSAYGALKSLVESYRARQESERMLTSFMRNVEQRARMQSSELRTA